MGQSSPMRTGRHVVFQMHVHLVFVTKYRKGMLTRTHLNHLRSIFRDVCDDFEATLVECNGEADHVHLLVEYPPKVSVSKLVNSLKGVSARIMRRDHADLARKTWGGHLWSPSYFAGSVGGAPLSVVAEYVRSQQQPPA